MKRWRSSWGHRCPHPRGGGCRHLPKSACWCRLHETQLIHVSAFFLKVTCAHVPGSRCKLRQGSSRAGETNSRHSSDQRQNCYKRPKKSCFTHPHQQKQPKANPHKQYTTAECDDVSNFTTHNRKLGCREGQSPLGPAPAAAGLSDGGGSFSEQHSSTESTAALKDCRGTRRRPIATQQRHSTGMVDCGEAGR